EANISGLVRHLREEHGMNPPWSNGVDAGTYELLDMFHRVAHKPEIVSTIRVACEGVGKKVETYTVDGAHSGRDGKRPRALCPDCRRDVVAYDTLVGWHVAQDPSRQLASAQSELLRLQHTINRREAELAEFRRRESQLSAAIRQLLPIVAGTD